MHIDSSLIQRCKNKERTAQEEMYKKLYPYMMGICYRYTVSKELSREIVNTAMYKVLTQIHTYDDKYPFKVWISKITVNCIIDEMRKNKQQQHIQYVDEYFDNDSYSEINAALSKMNANEIIELIEKLDDTEKMVFNLYCIEGYSHQEIAKMINISEGTSKWYLNQARNKLKEMINKIYSNILLLK